MSRKKKKQLSLADIGHVCTLCFEELELRSSACDHEKVWLPAIVSKIAVFISDGSLSANHH